MLAYRHWSALFSQRNREKKRKIWKWSKGENISTSTAVCTAHVTGKMSIHRNGIDKLINHFYDFQ